MEVSAGLPDNVGRGKPVVRRAIMPSNAHDDIRRLLKEFGLTADETVSAYFIEEKPAQSLRLRIVLEDVTPYEKAPARSLRVEVAGDVRP
jgi:hypothetical protein